MFVYVDIISTCYPYPTVVTVNFVIVNLETF